MLPTLRLRAILFVLIALTLGGCGGGSATVDQALITTPEPSPAATGAPPSSLPIAISPATATLVPGGTLTFSGTGGSHPYRFAITTNRSGARIDAASGVYHAGPGGNVGDVVSVFDGSGSVASAIVNVGPSVVLAPATATLAPRGTVTFVASRGAGGYTFSLPTNPSGGTIDTATGVYVAGPTPNTTDVVKVTDRLGGSITAEVNVGPTVRINPTTATVAPQGRLDFRASLGSATGYVFSLSTNLSGATIDPHTGAYVAGPTANKVDVVEVEDSLGNRITAEVSVGPAVHVTPATATLAPRAALTFTAGQGSGTGYAFTLSTNLSGATIDATTGAYVAGPTGNVTDVLQVTDSLGNSITAEVNVGPTVRVTPTAATLAPLGNVSFVASQGSGVGYAFTLSTNLSGATIHPSSGVYTAGPTGNVTDVVQVTDSLGNSVSAQVNVGPRVQIGPTAANVVPRGTEQFTARLGSGAGYIWSLPDNRSGGTIDPVTGAYEAGGVGDVTDVVEVTDSLGNTATATVNVGPVVTVTPDGPSIGPTQSIAFSATGGSGTGYVWSLSSNLSGGSIDARTGAYKAGATPFVTDVVSVTDSLGNSTTSQVGVGGNPFTVTAGAHTLDTDADTYDGNPMEGLAGGRWSVGAFTVVAGATVTVTGSRALVISSIGNVQIDGAILARGGNGANAVRAIPGAGGVAGPGGFAGGLGGDAVPNIGTTGQGPGGGGLGRGTPVVSGGGGGGGHATAGQPGTGQLVGVGGAAYGANDIPTELVGGSGGGGGGRSSGAFTQGGGGGGGGGVVRIVTSVGTVVVSASATIDVRGGNGGNGTTPPSGNGASGGGGGSGGSVWLTGRVTPTVSGTILLSGGTGGLGLITGAPFVSGNGGTGASGTLLLQP